ncbi:hypothetical protein JTE90_004883 [Oedothorax gibbosus]|uniref:SOCS box domain-containing protein n=1 Tax=Oedothorax gibbosus TaxID=931172 RepID=A0AAV6USF8_9ARAC|nr:hypothetical protein JTE90_004883 [Oedothorax gibbosus]
MEPEVEETQPAASREDPVLRQAADSIKTYAPLDKLRVLLTTGVDLDAPLNHGLRLVHYAVYHRHMDALTLLLVRGANPSVMDDSGHSPMHMAAETGFCNVVKTLLCYGARVDFSKVLPGDIGYCYPQRASPAYEPLHLALKNGCYRAAELLLKNGANPHTRYHSGFEINFLDPLDTKGVELLLRHGADPNARNAQGITLLMKACRSPEGIATARLLINYGADVNATTPEEQRTPLHCAVLSGNAAMVQVLHEGGARVVLDPSYTKPPPFFFAMLKSDFAMMSFLLEIGADINQGSATVGSCLHVALTELGQSKASIVKFLLENGADPNAVLYSGFRTILAPPLGEYFSSVPNPDITIVRNMLRYGAKIVLQGHRQHPLGILQTLHHLDARTSEDVLELVAEAAESFSVQLIDSSRLMSTRHKLVLLKRAMAPHSLKHCARLALRNILGWGPILVAAIQELPVPIELRKYLLFDE